MTTNRIVQVLLSALIAGSLWTAPVFAGDYDPGASDTKIRIGNTIPYSGPLSAYGTVGRAIASYFDMINANGGINGRTIEFVTLDDGYSPPKTVEQVRRLIEHEEVLLLFSNAGTPTNSAVHKYVNARKMPHLFLYTGASKWAQPEAFPWTIGYWPAYSTEGEIYANYILENYPDAKIGILYQNDDYGKDYLDGLRAGLGDRADEMIVAEQPFETTDPTIDAHISILKNSGATVFFDVATAKHAAQAIRQAYDVGWHPIHFLNNVSTSVDVVLKPAGLDKAKGILTAAFLKDPTDPQWAEAPDYLAWREWMGAYYPEGSTDDIYNAYGYGVAFAMAQVLEQCGDTLTRANVMKQVARLENLEVPMFLPGIRVNTSPTDFRPIEQLQLMRFNGEKWELFGEVIEAE